MWPGFDSRTRRHMWVEFVVGSRPCSERFFSGYSGFPLSSKKKPTFPNSNSIWTQWKKSHPVDPLLIPIYLYFYLFLFYSVQIKTKAELVDKASCWKDRSNSSNFLGENKMTSTGRHNNKSEITEQQKWKPITLSPP